MAVASRFTARSSARFSGKDRIRSLGRPGCGVILRPLSTQLYFSTDEVFAGDPGKNYSKDPLISSRTLVRPVTLSGKPEAPHASVDFELVMEKA